MADLFLRIAERALGLAPTIQPMIAPLFAPSAYTEDDEMLDIAATEEQESRRSNSSVHALLSGESNSHLEQSLHSGTSNSASKETFVAHQLDTSPVMLVERNTPVQPDIQRPFAQTGSSMSERAEPAYQHTPMRTAPVAPASDAAEDGLSTGFPLIERPEKIQEVRRDTPASLKPVQPLPTIMPPTSFSRQQLPQFIGEIKHTQYKPPQTPARDNSDKFSGARRAEHSWNEPFHEGIKITEVTPAVHITIGRIEVRANPVTAQEARKQRQQVTPKTMGLDEYLKQSEKGGH